MSIFFDKVIKLCTDRGISVTKLCSDIGIAASTGTDWRRKGAIPRASTLKAMSDYFGVPVEYLTNDDIGSVQTMRDNHDIIGNTHAPVTIINGSERKLSEQEVALLNIFGKLSVIDQAKLIVFAEELSNK